MIPNLIKMVFSVARGNVSLTEIVRDTGIPKSTAYHHLQGPAFKNDAYKQRSIRLSEYGQELIEKYAVVRNRHDKIIGVGQVCLKTKMP